MRQTDIGARVGRTTRAVGTWHTATVAVVVWILATLGPVDPALGFHSLTDVSVTNVASSPTVRPGDNITYTITVTNNTPHASTGLIVLTDVLPNGTTFVSMTGTFPFAFHVGTPGAGQPCATPALGNTGTVTCTGTLSAAGVNPADSASFTLIVKVASDTPPGTMSNTATATLPQGTRQQGFDPDLGNNSAIAVVQVQDTQRVKPGKGCGDGNHVHQREGECKKAAT